MSFGVPALTSGPRAAETPPQSSLLATARSVAEQLVADLRQARQLTAEWANENLTDALVAAALARCLAQLSQTGCWGEANRLPSNELWRIAGPLLQVGVLQHRARFKPQGYAGDYQMLDWILTHYHCAHPLGRAFDRYFQSQAAPAAVRSRTEQIAQALVAHCLQTEAAAYHVVSVGAGPANDMRLAVGLLPEEHRARLYVTLLDLDPDALEFARRQIEPLLPAGRLQCLRENLYRLPRARRPEQILGAPDFLVCSGLFDYLADEAAGEMLRLFWQRLRARGVLLVGNFAPHNPTRAYMEWLGNWYLTYRTADDLQRLALQAGMPASRFVVTSERLGVDLFLVARKPSE